MYKLQKMNLVTSVDTDAKRDELIKKGWKLLDNTVTQDTATTEEAATKATKK